MKNRRRKHLINKPFQFRYMAYIGSAFLILSSVIIANLYFGIWGSVLDAFSDKKTWEDLVTAARISEYEAARIPDSTPADSFINLFNQAEKLSLRQREILKGILAKSNRELTVKLVFLLILMAWGTIFISHRVAGPLYHIHRILREMDRGDLTQRVHLRKFDEAQFVADQLNLTFKNLDDRISLIKKIAGDRALQPDELKKRLENELSQIKTSADR